MYWGSEGSFRGPLFRDPNHRLFGGPGASSPGKCYNCIPGPSKHPTYYDMSHFSHNLGGSAKLSIRSSSAGFFFTSHPPPPCTDCYASLASLIVHLCQVIVMVPSHMKEILKPLKTFFPQSPYSRMWARLQGVRGGLGGS